ncbi:hypothetical protein LCGC14_1802760, partial [marine sediment metagenome]
MANCNFVTDLSLAKGYLTVCTHCGLKAEDVRDDKNLSDECGAAARQALAQYKDRLGRAGMH